MSDKKNIEKEKIQKMIKLKKEEIRVKLEG